MKFHFDCVFYYVADLRAAVNFYSKVPGLKLISQDEVARFDIDGVLFELVPGKPGGTGNGRLALRVDEINSACAQLRSKGVPVSEVQEKSNGKLAFFWDPDGNEIALWQYTR